MMSAITGNSVDCNKVKQHANPHKKIILPNDFIPGDNDVIVGRGKKCYNHIGNRELRHLVIAKLDKYSCSTCKHNKSNILSDIIAQIRQKGGGFVKKEEETGQWYDVGDMLARDKVSQGFRDALHEQYRSSTTFKRKVRQGRRRNNVAFSSTRSCSQMEQQFNSRKQKLNQWIDWTQYSSTSPDTLDLESTRADLINVLEKLSSCNPDILNEEGDPFEPIPIL